MLDEPETFTPGQREHVAACAHCSAQLQELTANKVAVEQALRGNAPVDAAAAFSRIRDAAVTTARPAWHRSAAGLAAAAAIALALIFTPLGTLARSFLTIFEPQQFTPLRITHAEIEQMRSTHGLLQADEIGTQRVLSAPKRTTYASMAAAQPHLDFTPLVPSVVPADLRGTSVYRVTTPETVTFTFSAAKARAFAARSHRSLPPMPAGLDGTTIRFASGDVLEMRVGSQKKAYVEIVQAHAPKVTSSGASLQTLEQYVLAMPNVPRALADEIRALGDLQNTVPVPVVIDKQTARHVTIDGADALAVGDNTGVGAGVMWQKRGMVYVVGGPLRMDDVLSIANGLK